LAQNSKLRDTNKKTNVPVYSEEDSEEASDYEEIRKNRSSKKVKAEFKKNEARELKVDLKERNSKKHSVIKKEISQEYGLEFYKCDFCQETFSDKNEKNRHSFAHKNMWLCHTKGHIHSSRNYRDRCVKGLVVMDKFCDEYVAKSQSNSIKDHGSHAEEDFSIVVDISDVA